MASVSSRNWQVRNICCSLHDSGNTVALTSAVVLILFLTSERNLSEAPASMNRSETHRIYTYWTTQKHTNSLDIRTNSELVDGQTWVVRTCVRKYSLLPRIRYAMTSDAFFLRRKHSNHEDELTTTSENSPDVSSEWALSLHLVFVSWSGVAFLGRADENVDYVRTP